MPRHFHAERKINADATGGAIARRFAREGYTACLSRRNIEKLHPLVQTIEESGGKVIF